MTIRFRLKRIRALSPRVNVGRYCIYGSLVDPPLRQRCPSVARNPSLEDDGELAGLLQRPRTPNGRTGLGPHEPGLQQESAVMPAYVEISPVVLPDPVQQT